jgi:hypothetical protein
MNNIAELYDQLIQIAKNGTEDDVRKFMIDNFNSWPEDIQVDLFGYFFEEGLAKTAEDLSLLTDYQKQLIDAYEYLEKTKKILEDKLKEQEIKAEILGDKSEENK